MRPEHETTTTAGAHKEEPTPCEAPVYAPFSEHRRALGLIPVEEALLDLDEMEAEDRLDGTHHAARLDRLVEADVVELLDHLARPERAERAAVLLGGTARRLARRVGEGFLAGVDDGLDRRSFVLRLDEDVRRAHATVVEQLVREGLLEDVEEAPHLDDDGGAAPWWMQLRARRESRRPAPRRRRLCSSRRRKGCGGRDDERRRGHRRRRDDEGRDGEQRHQECQQVV
mmetsp:Transcript_23274/g.92311  ORF Transcript_23274/g.92311 Transcript_23274/m.92311 type:complete len:228 (-) Transcript_23274:67-750(-)